MNYIHNHRTITRRHPFVCMVALLMLAIALPASATDIAAGKSLFNQGQYKQAADFFAGYLKSHADDKTTPEALVWLGRSLDKYATDVNNDAERLCYRSKGAPHTPQCMVNYAKKMNAQYGAGAFQYFPTQVLFRYMGTHYQQVLAKYPNSPEAAGAAYHDLEKNLIGTPDEVLPRVQEYIKKYPKNPWNLRARLLYARLNEDIWWIHRKWSWMLYNSTLSQDDLAIRGEKYRQAALKAYGDIIKKDSKTAEGRIARQEYDLLKDNRDDGRLYGIVSDAMTSGEAGFQKKRDK